jgi:Fic family protein
MSSSSFGRYVTTSVAGEPVKAFVPASLPARLPARLTADLSDSLHAAEDSLARLDLAGEMIPSVNWFIYAFVRKEALLSSEIEGTQATLVDVFTYEHTAQAGSSSVDDIEEVTNYVAAINHARGQIHSKRGLPISVRLLNDCHRRLMQGVRGAHKQPGEIRRSQNWVGGTRPGNAVYVLPPADRVAGLLDNLEAYIHDPNDLPALLRIALAHAQFETIHPYLDGNGRVGRMLIALLLDHWGLLRSPLLYLSVYLKENQAEYYRWLSAVRTDGDWPGWFRFFLRGIEIVAQDAAGTARALYHQVGDDRRALLAAQGVTVSAIRLFELLPEHPVVSMPLVTRLLETTKPTAGKAIGLLEKIGILSEIGQRKRDRVFSYQNYVRVLT